VKDDGGLNQLKLSLITRGAFVGHGRVKKWRHANNFFQIATQFSLSFKRDVQFSIRMCIALIAMRKRFLPPFRHNKMFMHLVNYRATVHADSCVTSTTVYEPKYQTKIAWIVQISASFNVSQCTASLLIMYVNDSSKEWRLFLKNKIKSHARTHHNSQPALTEHKLGWNCHDFPPVWIERYILINNFLTYSQKPSHCVRFHPQLYI